MIFPLPLASFFERLPIMEMTLDLPEAVEFSRLGSGEILAADLGTRLWTAQVSLGNMTRAEIAESRAKINTLRAAAGSFLAFDVTRPFPLKDQGGVILGVSTPIISALPEGNLAVSLSGLPAGYELSAGDLIGWTYGTAPLRYAMHEVAFGGIADGSGQLSALEMTTFIRAGVTLGAAVTLVRAPFKAKIVPGTTDPGATQRFYTSGFVFSLVQTLR